MDDIETLHDFVSSSPFLSFDKSNPIDGIYRGVLREESTKFKGTYQLVFSIEVEGEIKKLSSGSKRLAQAFLDAGIKKGDFVRITRSGTGTNSTFTVEVSADGIPF